MTTLILGVVFLGGLSLWRLNQDAGPPSTPPLPAELPPEERARLAAEQGLVHFDGKTMGTTYSVKYVPPHRAVIGMPRVMAESALEVVNDSMSTYRPHSEISLFNQISIDKEQKTSIEFWQVLQLSKALHAKTKGAFDITVGPLVKAFGFGAGAKETPPSEEELELLKERVGMQHITFSDENRSISKKTEGVVLDMSGVAKGFGVDLVAQALEKQKVAAYMIEVGGEVRTLGEKADGVPWKLGIEEPSPEGRKLHATLALPKEGASLATSGDYRSFHIQNGKTISHTFDPRAGTPVPKRTASVSVVRPTAAEADGLATALGVLAPEEAIQLANEQGWAVYLLVHDEKGGFSSLSSKAFERFEFELVSRPPETN